MACRVQDRVSALVLAALCREGADGLRPKRCDLFKAGRSACQSHLTVGQSSNIYGNSQA